MNKESIANNRQQPELEIFKLVTDQVGDLVIISDLNFIPTYVNTAGLQALGFDSLEQIQQLSTEGLFFPEDQAFIKNKFLPKVLAVGKNECEIRFKHFKTNEAAWMIHHVFLLKDNAGKPIGYASISKNISKQKNTEKALKESNDRFYQNIQHAPVAMCIFRGKGHVVDIVNERMLELWGKTKEQVLGKPIFEGLPEAKAQGIKELMDTVFKTGEKYVAYERQVNLTRNDKTEAYYVDLAYNPISEVNGTVSGIILVATNVTKQVNARKQIKLSEKRFNNFIMQSPTAMLVLKGPEHLIEIANEAMLKRWNISSENITNKKFTDVFPQVDGQKTAWLLDDVYSKGKPIRETEAEYIFPGVEGNKVSYIDAVFSPILEPDGSVSGIIAIVNDVTDKVESRRKIEESEQRYHSLVYSSPSGIAMLSGKDLVITTANDAIVTYWGKGKDIIGKPYFEALPELIEQGYKEVFEEVYATGEPYNAVEMPVSMNVNGDLKLGYFNFSLYAQKNVNGEIDGIGILATEVTSQALLNKKIKESEEKFAAAVQAVNGIIWTNNEKGEMYGEQSGWSELTGQRYEEYQRYGWANAVHPEDAKPSVDSWNEAVREVKVYKNEHRLKVKDGSWRYFSVKAVPMLHDDGSLRGWVGVHTDIQEQYDFETELERQVGERTIELEQKNNDLDRLNKELQSFAYISSHDLQEPLRKIRTFTSRILEKEKANLTDSGKDMFNRMQNAALRMQNLIDDLLSYSRTNTDDRKFELIDLNQIVDEVRADLAEELQEKNAILETNDLPELRIIRFQFCQLLQNLISNSLKFSKQSRPSHINITGKIAPGATFNRDLLKPQSNYYHLRVSDNGIGFEQKYSDKIFELFQRLHGKHSYEGTGIGLAIVKKIVENHDGFIYASSKLDNGAHFDIYIPVT